MSDNIISLAQRTQNGCMETPEQLIERVQQEITSGELKGASKVVVLTLNDSDDNYNISFRQCGMKMSEMIALLETVKSVALKEMGY